MQAETAPTSEQRSEIPKEPKAEASPCTEPAEDNQPTATPGGDGDVQCLIDIGEADLYALLGLDKEASEKDLRKAYKQKSLRMHPDKGGNTEEFQAMKEAYEILLDPQKRATYDLKGIEGVRKMEAAQTDVMPPEALLQSLGQMSLFQRLLTFILTLFAGCLVTLPFILFTLKWDGDQSFSWALAFVPVWPLQLVHLIWLLWHLRPQAANGQVPEQQAARRMRVDHCISVSLLLLFEVLLVCRLEDPLFSSWLVILPWVMLEVWWLYSKLRTCVDFWQAVDPVAAAEAGGQVLRSSKFWLFIFSYLQMGVCRLLTALLIAARADVAQGASWWLVLLPLYLSSILLVVLACLVSKLRKDAENPGGPLCCIMMAWLSMVFLSAGKLDGGDYSAAWVFWPIFTAASFAACCVGCMTLATCLFPAESLPQETE